MATLYAATDGALLVANRQRDGSWASTWHESDARMECVAATADVALVGTAAGDVRRVTDDGSELASVATLADRVTSLSVSPHDEATVWAGTEPSRFFRSTDGGDSWTERPGLADLPSADRWSFPPRPHTHHVRWIQEDIDERDRLYLAIEAGAFVRSPDGGETWLDHPDGARLDNHTIAMHPDAPGRLYVAAGDGYAESSDGGDTWRYPQDGLEHRYVWGLAVAPDDPGDVFVSAASGAFAAHDPDGTSHVYRRDGDEWEVAMDGLPGPDGLGRAVLASGPEAVYAATNHGLFRCGDGWERVPIEWPDARREELPRGLAVVV